MKIKKTKSRRNIVYQGFCLSCNKYFSAKVKGREVPDACNNCAKKK